MKVGGALPRALALMLHVLLVCFTTGVSAQQPLSDGAGVDQIRRPGQLELPAPEFEEPEPAPELVLPPIRPRSDAERTGSELRVYVHGFLIEGSTVFTAEQLAEIVAPYERREITSDELLELRDSITVHYINAGYLNSGAIIPDQKIIDGVITLRVIEGELTALHIEGNDRLRTDYVRQRVLLAANPPLNVDALQERLELLQEDPIIERINAAITPGSRPGQSELHIELQERQPYSLGMVLNNHRPPSVGAEQVIIEGENLNLTGRGDTLRASYSLTSGLDDVYLDYRIPVTRDDTMIGLYAEKTDAEVVEQPFSDLDIESDSWTAGILISHPLYKKPGEHFSIGALLERRSSITYLLGERFSFAPGVNDGKSDVTVLRLTQDWLRRSRNQVLAAHSAFSFGMDALGSTDNSTKPDGVFTAWLGQFQWAQRLGKGNTEVIFRVDTQLTNDPLLPMEKFVVGGVNTVRGYRENELVRDNGLVLSLEYRIPVMPQQTGESRVRFAVFSDYGRSWNDDEDLPHEEIASAGAGLLLDHKRLHAQLYWAHAFDRIDRGTLEHDLQDDGISFQVTYDVF